MEPAVVACLWTTAVLPLVVECYSDAMARRLQVLMDESDLREIRRQAGQEHVSMAEWVRKVLRQAMRPAPAVAAANKLAAIRAATRHRFPTADIDEMLAEIGRGCRAGWPA